MRLRKLLGHLLTIVMVTAVCCFVRYGLRLIMVSGDSMYPTYSDGEIIKYSPVKESLAQGQVVLFKENGTGKTLIKRIIALPGDEVAVVNKKLYVNGEELSEYSFGLIEAPGILSDGAVLLLQEEEYFCVGDNYKDSRDSRDFGPVKKAWIFGLVPEK